MSKVKMPKTSVHIDMTPMVDMAFLLVTFFILTTKFRPDEPVQVSTPTASMVREPQERGLITITIAPDGRIFFDMDNQNNRMQLIRNMGEAYGIQFSVDQQNAFATGSSIGVPMSQIQDYLSREADERKQYPQTGIPVDSTENLSNELSVWLKSARGTNPNAQILIKGDNKANYPFIKDVLSTLQNQDATSFGLITGEEAEAITKSK